MWTLRTRSPQKKHVLQTLCQPCSHVFLFAAVDLCMTLLQANFFFSVPHSFNVYFVWGDFPYRYHSFSDVWKEAKKYASSSVCPVIDLAIG